MVKNLWTDIITHSHSTELLLRKGGSPLGWFLNRFFLWPPVATEILTCLGASESYETPVKILHIVADKTDEVS